METLPEQFNGALEAIEINGVKRERAIAAHTEIRELLEGDAHLCALGIDTVLIGSYARRTGIYPGKDVDVFVKLTKLDTTADPHEVFDAVQRVLVAHYGDRAEPQRRSVKVTFDKDGFSVDAVPAVRLGERWALPNHDPARWQDPGGRWIETDPEKMKTLTEERNEALKIGGRGAYVPTVKMLRQSRREHLGDAKPGGFYFEVMAYWVFKADGISGGSFAEVLAATLRAVHRRLASGDELVNPVLDQPFAPAPEPHERAAAAAAFDRLASDAERALTSSRCRAAAIWRAIFGSNDRGPCFPLPDGCDEHGNQIAAVSAVSARGSGEARGFG